MTTSTMLQPTARHTAARPTGRLSTRQASGSVAADGSELSGVLAGVDCEDGCHYCQGPETD